MLATDYDKNGGGHIPKIIIESINHEEQRYETPGDWYYDVDGNIRIFVSETSPKYEFLVALHEFVEVMLCRFKDIPEDIVTKFDEEFEEMRNRFPQIVGNREPGDDDSAPYYHEHKMASRVEHWIADSFGVNWDEYEKTIDSLGQF